MRLSLALCFSGTCSVLIGGCTALGPPSASHPRGPAARHTPAQAAKLERAQQMHEYPSGTQPPDTAADGSPTPVQAVRRFATAYVNWTAQTVGADMRSLAAESVGQARSATQLAAAQTANDYELQRGGIANSGTVEAVAPLVGAHNRYVVATREQTTAINTNVYQGLQPAWHLSIATVVQLPSGGWVLSGWQPEN